MWLARHRTTGIVYQVMPGDFQSSMESAERTMKFNSYDPKQFEFARCFEIYPGCVKQVLDGGTKES